MSIDDQTWKNGSCNPIYHNGTSILGDPNAGKQGCSIGNYPPYAVDCTEPAHVRATLKFAGEHNLRLNIKNTGHSEQGGYDRLNFPWKDTEFLEELTFVAALLMEAYREQNLAILSIEMLADFT